MAKTDDWLLTDEQYAYMMVRRYDIERAYINEDDSFFDEIENSDEYKRLFGDMSWNEAYDRFEDYF